MREKWLVFVRLTFIMNKTFVKFREIFCDDISQAKDLHGFSQKNSTPDYF